MEKTTEPTDGWWWLSVLNDGYFEIVQVYSGGKSDFFQRAGVNNFFEIDGKYEFWGPIPQFVPPIEPVRDPNTDPRGDEFGDPWAAGNSPENRAFMARAMEQTPVVPPNDSEPSDLLDLVAGGLTTRESDDQETLVDLRFATHS